MTGDRRGRIGTVGRVVMTAAQIDRDEVAWHRARARGVTATDARVLTGHGYADETVYARWQRKVNADWAPDDDDADLPLRFAMGQAIEPRLTEIAAQRIGVKARRVGLVQHGGQPILLADPDRQTDDGGGLELKRTGTHYLSRYDGAEGMPLSNVGASMSPAWWAQIQHQMLVTGWPHVHLAAYEADRDRLHLWTVDADKREHDRLAVLAGMFWQHVVSRTPPPIEWDTVTKAEVQARYPQVLEEQITIVDPSEADRLLAELTELEAAEKAASARIDQIKNRMRGIAGEACSVLTPDGRKLWTWADQSRNSVDTKRLLEEHPELAGQYRRTTSFRVLRISRPRKTSEKETAA